MSDYPTCGDSGGYAETQGRPCGRRVAEEGDRCPQHPTEGEPAPAGRPRIELSTDQIQRVEQLAGFGLTMQEVAEVLNVSPNTVRARLTDTPEFSEAYARGRATAKTRAAGRYHQIAFNRSAGLGLPDGETVPIGEQRRALRHILESGLDYKDRRHLEHSGPGGGPIEVDVDDARERLVDELDKIAERRASVSGPQGNGAGS